VDAEPEKDRLQLAAIVLASSVLGVPLVITAAAPVLLGERSSPWTIGGIFVVGFAGTLIALGLVLSRLARRDDARQVLRVPYVILLVQLVFGVLAAALFLLSIVGSAS
jgi:drug/metabolite transporter (DMT)-like permease